MRYKYLITLMIISFLQATLHAFNNDNAETNKITAEEVLLTFIDSAGGSILANIEAIARKGTLVRGENGAVPFETYSKSDGRLFYKQVFAYGDVVNYIFNKKEAWCRDTKKIIPLTEEEKLDLQILADHQLPIKLKSLFPQVSIRQNAADDQSGNIIVNAVSANGIERELEFDTNTGLLLRTGDIYFAKYIDTVGIKLPSIIYIGNAVENKLRLRMEIKENILNPTVPDTLFAYLNYPLGFEKSQLYTLRRQITISKEAMEKCVGVYQDIEDKGVKYSVTMQKNHLMFQTVGRGPKIEIKPESETDFFIRFLNLEFHFLKDEKGKIAFLQMGSDKKTKAIKIL